MTDIEHVLATVAYPAADRRAGGDRRAGIDHLRRPERLEGHRLEASPADVYILDQQRPPGVACASPAVGPLRSRRPRRIGNRGAARTRRHAHVVRGPVRPALAGALLFMLSLAYEYPRFLHAQRRLRLGHPRPGAAPRAPRSNGRNRRHRPHRSGPRRALPRWGCGCSVTDVGASQSMRRSPRCAVSNGANRSGLLLGGGLHRLTASLNNGSHHMIAGPQLAAMKPALPDQPGARRLGRRRRSRRRSDVVTSVGRAPTSPSRAAPPDKRSWRAPTSR